MLNITITITNLRGVSKNLFYRTCSSISGLAAEIHSQHATALSNDCLVNSLDGDQHTLLNSFLSRSINKKTTYFKVRSVQRFCSRQRSPTLPKLLSCIHLEEHSKPEQ